MKPQYRILLIAAVVFGVALFYMASTNGDVGTVRRTDAGITRVYAKVDADQVARVPIRLQEGGDVEHESAHVFSTLQGMKGVESATLSLDGTSIEVRYVAGETSEEWIRKAFEDTGYASRN